MLCDTRETWEQNNPGTCKWFIFDIIDIAKRILMRIF